MHIPRYTNTCTHIHYAHTYMHTHTYAHAHMHKHMHTHTYAHTYMHKHIHTHVYTYPHPQTIILLLLCVHLYYMQLQTCAQQTFTDDRDQCGTNKCELILHNNPPERDQVNEIYTCCCRENFCNAHVNVILPMSSPASSSPPLPTTTTSKDCHITNCCVALIMTLHVFFCCTFYYLTPGQF